MERRPRYSLTLVDEEQSAEIEVWRFEANESGSQPTLRTLMDYVKEHEEEQYAQPALDASRLADITRVRDLCYSIDPTWVEDLDSIIEAFEDAHDEQRGHLWARSMTIMSQALVGWTAEQLL